MAGEDSTQAVHGEQDVCRKLAFGGQVVRSDLSALREV